mmetsp:Transcript_9428/g.39587  ORF Transcript_9428/g.39587 Transcript_9428/m.39587 type:complete len:388 (+) Transcript_9428:1747-2910(+)
MRLHLRLELGVVESRHGLVFAPRAKRRRREQPAKRGDAADFARILLLNRIWSRVDISRRFFLIVIIARMRILRSWILRILLGTRGARGGEQLPERRRRRRRLHLGDSPGGGGHRLAQRRRRAHARVPRRHSLLDVLRAELPVLLAQDAREVARAAKLPGNEHAVDQVLGRVGDVSVCVESVLLLPVRRLGRGDVSRRVEDRARRELTPARAEFGVRKGVLHDRLGISLGVPRGAKLERGDDGVRAESRVVASASSARKPGFGFRGRRGSRRGIQRGRRVFPRVFRIDGVRGKPRAAHLAHERPEPELRDAHLQLERRRRGDARSKRERDRRAPLCRHYSRRGRHRETRVRLLLFSFSVFPTYQLVLERDGRRARHRHRLLVRLANRS